ncbi:MAG: PAS domain-containing protein [Acidobacteria bacterium]|nr:PAS domain-containing protein [Acidobacteriota bacterium]MCW5971206.1 PAS domain-containing protein [Blastocatellales bacterium]
MTQERRQILLATAVMVAVFGLYETAKTLLFPAMEVVTSHVVSTVVVGVITIVTARYVIRQQLNLLRERELSNRRLREALGDAERSGSLLASIVASVAEGLVIIDRDSQVLLVNDAARSLLGISDRPVARLSEVSRDPQVHRAFSSVLSTGERAEARIEIWSGSGDAGDQRRVLHLHAAPLRLGEVQTDGVVGALIDITKLERLERVRQEFLANVSHELRTPLASITAYIETLLDGAIDDNENSLRFLHTIQRNAERMRDLVNDVAELSAIETGRVRLNMENLPLRRVVAEVFNGLAHRGARYGIHMRNLVDEDCTVAADPRRLEQILTNLVDNAIKFNRPGGELRITAATSDDGQYTLIRVRDTGPGIAPEHLPRVFERFYRVDKARSREAGGTGLGLAIVKHLARAHGGEAYVTSEPGSGCEFTVKLPVRPVAANTGKSSTAEFTGREVANG